MRKEIVTAKKAYSSSIENVEEKRTICRDTVRDVILPSVVFHSRTERKAFRREKARIHAKKLENLSRDQDRPLLNVSRTVITYNLNYSLPKFVLDTLSLGPKCAVLDTVNPKNILAELDLFLSFCKSNKVSDEIITDINIKTLAYIKKCQKQKSPRNIAMTKQYLKEDNLLAIPFDEGMGICVMDKSTYHSKLDKIISLPQFEKVLPKRKNEKHPVLKEEEIIIETLKTLKSEGEISEELFDKIKPRGSQPARLYGLSKVHKKDTSLRPVLSMPGSAYHKIAVQVTEWLSVVDECKINSSTKSIADSLKSIKLDEDEVIVSFDVASLYTNVPVTEAIDVCSDLLFSGKYQLPPVNKPTFKKLLEIATCNVLMLTHDGYYRQRDGLAMGSPPAPPLANGWLHSHDHKIRDDAKLYSRYIDDIIRSISKCKVETKLREINNLHPSLSFTIETEIEGQLPFLDMKITRSNCNLSSTWYCKPTDTGLIMNFHALAPTRYKRSVVCGFVHRIYRACSTWENFHSSLERAIKILHNNQYPADFYEPLIRASIEKLYVPREISEPESESDEVAKHMVFLQYRGKITEEYVRALHKLNAPCKPILTLRKLKTILPTLKVQVDKECRARIVYKVSCPRCKACYVGQTDRHYLIRFREHCQPSRPFGKHIRLCGVSLAFDNKEHVSIIQSTHRSIPFLEALEALWQKEIRPTINTKDEYRSRELTIKL